MKFNSSTWLGPRPPFVSRQATVIYVLAMGMLFLLPLIAHRANWIRPETRYFQLDGSANLTSETFQKREPIDLLLFGNSFVLTGINTPFIKSELSKAVGSPLNVRTLAVDWPGLDVIYALLKDTLDRRTVRQVILGLTGSKLADEPHMNSPRWWRYGENREALQDLPEKYQWQLYAGDVLGILRALALSLSSPDLNGAVIDLNDGFQSVEKGYEGAAFQRTHLLPSPKSEAQLISKWSNADPQSPFEFKGELSPYDRHFAQLIGKLLQEKGIPFAFIHIPQFSLRAKLTLPEAANWQGLFGVEAPMIGVPAARLFAGLTEEQITTLYFNDHLNLNGSEYLARATLPALKEFYAKNSNLH